MQKSMKKSMMKSSIKKSLKSKKLNKSLKSKLRGKKSIVRRQKGGEPLTSTNPFSPNYDPNYDQKLTEKKQREQREQKIEIAKQQIAAAQADFLYLRNSLNKEKQNANNRKIKETKKLNDEINILEQQFNETKKEYETFVKNAKPFYVPTLTRTNNNKNNQSFHKKLEGERKIQAAFEKQYADQSQTLVNINLKLNKLERDLATKKSELAKL